MTKRTRRILVTLLVIGCMMVEMNAIADPATMLTPKIWVNQFEALAVEYMDHVIENVDESRPSTVSEGDWIHGEYDLGWLQVVLAGRAEDECNFATAILFPNAVKEDAQEIAMRDFIIACSALLTTSIVGEEDDFLKILPEVEEVMRIVSDEDEGGILNFSLDNVSMSATYNVSTDPYYSLFLTIEEEDSVPQSVRTFERRYASVSEKYGYTFEGTVAEEARDDSSPTDLYFFDLPDGMYGRLALQDEEIKAVFICAPYQSAEKNNDEYTQALLEQAFWVLSSVSDISAFTIDLFKAQLQTMSNIFVEGKDQSWSLEDWTFLVSNMTDDPPTYVVALYNE